MRVDDDQAYVQVNQHDDKVWFECANNWFFPGMQHCFCIIGKEDALRLADEIKRICETLP
jgi:hypothetical protein